MRDVLTWLSLGSLLAAACASDAPRTSSIGGTVEGLEGAGLALSTPGEPELPVPAGATSFRFPIRVAAGTAYAVTVAQQPSHPRQWCTVAGGDGIVGDADVVAIAVSCRRLGPRLAAGAAYSAAVRADGTLRTWGENGHGQLGDGTTTTRLSPIEVGGGFASVAATTSREFGNQTGWTIFGFTLAIDEAGALWAWGSNSHGQLGDGTTTDRTSPVQIGSGFVSAAAGDRHAAGIKRDGTLWTWGDNMLGQLGDGTRDDRLLPVQVGSGFAAVAAGSWHTMAIKTDGTLWGWGSNYYGEVGDGTFAERLLPVQIGSGYAAVAAAAAHTAAVRRDGTLWTWGQDGYGPSGYQFPGVGAPVQQGSGFGAVSAGAKHFAAVATDGTLWTWGWNGLGQLGDGTLTDREAPVPIAEGFAAVAAGLDHTLAVRRDGTVWAWGANDFGQLGDGTTAPQRAPVQVGSGFGE